MREEQATDRRISDRCAWLESIIKQSEQAKLQRRVRAHTFDRKPTNTAPTSHDCRPKDTKVGVSRCKPKNQSMRHCCVHWLQVMRITGSVKGIQY